MRQLSREEDCGAVIHMYVYAPQILVKHTCMCRDIRLFHEVYGKVVYILQKTATNTNKW
jgi:hypothetical protein